MLPLDDRKYLSCHQNGGRSKGERPNVTELNYCLIGIELENLLQAFGKKPNQVM